MNRHNLILALTLTPVALSLSACGQETGGPAPAATQQAAHAARPAFAIDGDAERGRDLYIRNCASCHGTEGRGDGPAGRALNPPAADLTVTDDAQRLYLVTRDGGLAHGLAPTMMAFKAIMDDQAIHDIVAHILELE